MTDRFVSRRGILASFAAAAVGGCVPFSGTSPFWGTIASGFRSNGRPGVDPEYVKKLPYASMLAWFEGAPKSLIVLGEISGDRRYTWYTADRQSITTFGPFVVGALGFDVELRNTVLGGGWRANPLEMVGGKLTRSLDVVAEGERVQVPITSTFVAGDTEAVTILGTTRELRRVREKVRYYGRTKFTNDYWIDPATGRCWKSRQTALPTLRALNLEVTKYPTV